MFELSPNLVKFNLKLLSTFRTYKLIHLLNTLETVNCVLGGVNPFASDVFEQDYRKNYFSCPQKGWTRLIPKRLILILTKLITNEFILILGKNP